MISNLNSETNRNSHKRSADRSISRKRGQWTVVGAAGSVNVAPPVDIGNLGFYGKGTHSSAFRIMHSADSVCDDTLDYETELIGIDSFRYSYPNLLKQVYDLGQVVVLYTSRFDSDAQSTAESLHEIPVTNLVGTTEEDRIDLSRELAKVFSLAAGEHFEDGMDTMFSREIGRFVRTHGLLAIANYRRAIEQNLFRESYLAEALLWIGELDNDETREARRILLEDACSSESVSVRDAAVSGLSYLGAAKSKRRLEKMLTVERVKDVRANIEAVLAYIRD